MNRATATAFALVMAMGAGGAEAQSVLWGGQPSSPNPAPSSPPSGPIWNAPGAGGFATTPPPSAGGTVQGFPTTPPPSAGPTFPGFPTTPPSVGGTFPGFPPAQPPASTSGFGPGSGAGGPGWPGGYGRWNRDRDAEPTYNAWRGDEAEKARELVQRLERLISAAERQRAADPEFLRDLRELLARYEGRDTRPGATPTRPGGAQQGPGFGGGPQQPPRPPAPPRVVLSDDFADGDFTRGTVWTPRQGQWGVDPANGLRSARPAAPQPVSRQISPQELLQALLVGPQSLGLGPQQTPPNAALIEYAQSVPNAFALKARIRDHRGEGALHLIAHQGGTNWNGYRLELRGGPEGRVVLSRRGASGYTDLFNAPLRRFAANVPHDVEWTRAANGAMTVRVDGETLFSVTDAGFRDDWRGFALFNAGGDYSVRSISIEENR